MRIDYDKPLYCPQCGSKQQVSLPIWVTPGNQEVDPAEVEYEAEPSAFYCPKCECMDEGAFSVKNWLLDVIVRRSNERCDFGAWMHLNDDDVPHELREAVACEAIEVFNRSRLAGFRYGYVEVGGQKWRFQKCD